MTILYSLMIILLAAMSFIAGLMLDNHYQTKAKQETKEALERQFLRLQVKADADDPVKPYLAPLSARVTGDFDGDDLLDEKFMQHLRENGRATTKLRNKPETP